MRRNFSALGEQSLVTAGYENVDMPYDPTEEGGVGKLRELLNKVNRPIAGTALFAAVIAPSLTACGSSPERTAKPVAAESGPASHEKEGGLIRLDTDGDGAFENYQNPDAASEAIKKLLSDDAIKKQLEAEGKDSELPGDRAVVAAEKFFTKVFPAALNWSGDREATTSYKNYPKVTNSEGDEVKGIPAAATEVVAPIFVGAATASVDDGVLTPDTTPGNIFVKRTIEEQGPELLNATLSQSAGSYNISIKTHTKDALPSDAKPGIGFMGGDDATKIYAGAIKLDWSDNSEKLGVPTELHYNQTTVQWALKLDDDGTWKLAGASLMPTG